MDSNRIQKLNRYSNDQVKRVTYWMSRDQRVYANWALVRAIEVAKQHDAQLDVIFALTKDFPGGNIRHYYFMLEGLKQVEAELASLGINFRLIIGDPAQVVINFIKNSQSDYLISDFSPLKIKAKWNQKILSEIKIPYEQVDAHNIVPCWLASDKQEFAARTFRPKIGKFFKEFCVDFPKIGKFKDKHQTKYIDWKRIYTELETDMNVSKLTRFTPGREGGLRVLDKFITERIGKYQDQRNDPTKDSLSDLSPYLHYGQLGPQELVLEVLQSVQDNDNRRGFLEELIVRRELSDNYCFYNPNYDNFNGFPAWAMESLNKHREDIREYLYNLEEFEQGLTHDELWNAAQQQMVQEGKMHGYMRMYWAKKILEWTESPEEAQRIAIYLNDKYELDGRDPNGYTGVAWSIGGVHDRPWFERPVYGKVRYMNFNGAKRKFDVEKYIDSYAKDK